MSATAERVTTTARLDEIGFYAWPGGYAVYYLDAKNGDDLCPTCARRELAEWEEICAVWDSAGEVHDLTIRPEFYLQTSDWSDDAVSGRGLMCGDCSGWIVPPDPDDSERDTREEEQSAEERYQEQPGYTFRTTGIAGAYDYYDFGDGGA